MILIFIRHAPDMDKDEGTYSQDVRLRQDAPKELDRFIPLMVKAYGFPTEIRYSPLRRTCETQKEMMKRLKKINPRCKIKTKRDPALSRFWTASERKNLDVHPKTLTYGPPIIPTEQAKENVTNMFLKLNQRAGKLSHAKDIVWCITHAVVIKHIRRITEGELRPEDNSQPFLYYLPIQFAHPSKGLTHDSSDKKKSMQSV